MFKYGIKIVLTVRLHVQDRVVEVMGAVLNVMHVNVNV